MIYSDSAARSLLLSILPEEYHSQINKDLTQSQLKKILTDVYKKYPDRYSDIVNELLELGRESAFFNTIFSPKPEDFQLPTDYFKITKKLEAQQYDLYRRYGNDRQKLLTEFGKLGAKTIDELQKSLLKDERLRNNALVLQVLSGARGNPTQLTGLLLGDIVYTDNKLDTIPIFVTRPFVKGLYPHQMWAGSYGARFGLYFLAAGTKGAGALNKELLQILHDKIVTETDSPLFYKYKLGYPVSTDDPDIVGSLLAQPVLHFKQNTLITPEVLAYLRQKGIDKILIRSPIISISKHGGFSSYDVGVRERNILTPVGEYVGIIAAQAVTEPITQAQISAKHTGGIKTSKRATDILQDLNLFFLPSPTAQIMAVHSDVDGVVKDIVKNKETGDYSIIIKSPDGTETIYYASQDDEILVKKGDRIEAGDQIIEGIPNLVQITKYKHIGEARRQFVQILDRLLQKGGIKANKKNLEILAAGVINTVVMTDFVDPFMPGDIVPYNKLAYYWKPRRGSKVVGVNSEALGKYLEEPVLHYTIGTKIRPSVLQTLKEFNIKEVTVHDDPPPFEPTYIRILDQLEEHEDWMTRQLGSHLHKSLVDALRRGAKSYLYGNVSFVPALAEGTRFGKVPYTYGPTQADIEKAKQETRKLYNL
jgi:DNA-directed RNA polymerase subunit beta'